MDIFKYDVYRGPNIGIYTKVNDHFVFVPNGYTKTKAKNLAKFLDADVVFTSVANTRLIGVLMIANNHGILLPSTSHPFEQEHLKKSTGLNVEVLDSKYTCLGNLICANDKGAVHGRTVQVLTDDLVHDLVGARDVAGNPVPHRSRQEVREAARGGVGLLHGELRPVDGVAVEARRGTGLEPRGFEAEGHQVVGEAMNRPLADATARHLPFAGVHESAQESAIGEDNGFRSNFDTHTCSYPNCLISFNKDLFHHLLPHIKVRYSFQDQSPFFGEAHADILGTRAPHGWPLGSI